MKSKLFSGVKQFWQLIIYILCFMFHVSKPKINYVVNWE